MILGGGVTNQYSDEWDLENWNIDQWNFLHQIKTLVGSILSSNPDF